MLAHEWAKHGRDYLMIVEDCLGTDPGQHEITFTRCVRLDYETRVSADVFQRSWTDEFTDYKSWQESGEPDGYVWGTNWSDANPGVTVVADSDLARQWAKRLNHEMYEVIVETDRFFMRIIFHSAKGRKLNDSTATISQTITPLPKWDSQQTSSSRDSA